MHSLLGLSLRFPPKFSLFLFFLFELYQDEHLVPVLQQSGVMISIAMPPLVMH